MSTTAAMTAGAMPFRRSAPGSAVSGGPVGIVPTVSAGAGDPRLRIVGVIARPTVGAVGSRLSTVTSERIVGRVFRLTGFLFRGTAAEDQQQRERRNPNDQPPVRLL